MLMCYLYKYEGRCGIRKNFTLELADRTHVLGN